MGPSPKITIRLAPAVLEELQGRALDKGISVSALVQETLRRVLRVRKRVKKDTPAGRGRPRLR